MAPKPNAAPPQPRWAWDPVDLELHEASAIKAIAAQNPVGFAVILDKICGVDRVSFAAGGEDGRRATDFAEGMRFVGNQLRRIRDVKMPSQTSRGAPPELPNSPTTPPPPATSK